MKVFNYIVIDRHGAKKESKLHAFSQEEARLILIKNKNLILNLEEGDQLPFRRKQLNIALRLNHFKLSSEELLIFLKELHALMRSGIALIKALTMIVEHTSVNRSKAIINKLINDVEKGLKFSEALKNQSHSFDNTFIYIAEVGERNGRMVEVLGERIRDLERQMSLQKKVKAALMYPAIVSLVACTVVFCLMYFIIPQFKSTLIGITNSKEFPLITQLVFKASEVIRHYLLAIFLILGSSGICLYLILRRRVKSILLGFLTGIPTVNRLWREWYYIRFLRTLALLVSSNVNLVSALEATRMTIGWRKLNLAIAHIEWKVKEGTRFSKALQMSTIFDKRISSVVEIAEETSQMALMLNDLAKTFEEALENRLQRITVLLEPMIIIVLAIVIGLIVIALFLPVMHIVQSLDTY